MSKAPTGSPTKTATPKQPTSPETSEKKNTMSGEAIGLIETKGLIAQIEALDSMLKSANVSLVKQIQIGGAYVTTIIKGDVGSVLRRRRCRSRRRFASRRLSKRPRHFPPRSIARPKFSLSDVTTSRLTVLSQSTDRRL